MSQVVTVKHLTSEQLAFFRAQNSRAWPCYVEFYQSIGKFWAFRGGQAARLQWCAVANCQVFNFSVGR